jgi:hypothetical protein
MGAELLYSDRLVEVTADSILFRCYSFPFGAKRVRFEEVAAVVPLRPTLWNGRWRLQGTGDFRTWFPLDWKRPRRDRIFLLHLKGRRRRIGFTVEDSAAVERILREKGLLVRKEA